MKVRHVIVWTLKPAGSPEEKEKIKKGIRDALENLNGKIPGLLSLRVRTEGLPSSNGDLMLDCLFSDAEALKTYASHPLHVAAADTYVRPYTAVRSCFDYVCGEE